VLAPAKVLDSVRTIDAGDGHTCAVRNDGTLWCWGDCSRGRCGVGTTANEIMPIQVAGITDAVTVTAGTTNTCVTRATGAVVCFGGGTFGQLGRTFAGALEPAVVCAP
jgi:alpha-tubulin suppressor-like RCC1 family protein